MKELLGLLCFMTFFTGCATDKPAAPQPEPPPYKNLDPVYDEPESKPIPDAPR